MTTDPGPDPDTPPRVPYPPGCRCPHPDPETCTEERAIHAARWIHPPPLDGPCTCLCHTAEPSPWKWHSGKEPPSADPVPET